MYILDFLNVYILKNKKFISKKWRSILSILFINLLFAFIYFYICDDENDWEESIEDTKNDGNNSIDVFFRRLYFSFVVFSSVGFGDIIPKSKKARLLVIIQIMLTMVGVLQILD